MPDSSGSVLILAPVGRDADVASAILREIGLSPRACPDLDSIVSALDEADCAVLTEEGLIQSNRQVLADWINQQPPWSDFPFILLTQRGLPPDPRLPHVLANVTVLERPFHPDVLANAARSAVRARKRQREVEAHLKERQRTFERQALLIRELHHRVRNTLATVQALLGASARSTGSVTELYRSFAGRIASLANTHNMLTEDYWQKASLREMLRAELAAFDDGAGQRITLTGPAVELTADLAVPTSMALHELASNAVRYGALSVPGGRVLVTWEVIQAEQERRLRLEWLERDGPPVEDPQRKGFGSLLLQRVLTTQCHAEVAFAFEAAGLRFSMEAPLVDQRLVPPYESEP